jgi:CheY-like chemotaxis protein
MKAMASKISSPVLLLSASEASAKLILEALEKHGLTTAWAKDERESIKYLGKQVFRIVVVDEDFCRNETIEFVESLKGLLPTNTDFVLLSNDPNVSVMSLHKAGVSCVLRKPLNVNQLLDHIARTLGSEGKRRFDGGQMHLDEFKNAFGVAFSGRKKHEELQSSISHLGRGGFFYETDLRQALPAVGTIVNFEVNLSMVPNTKLVGKGIVRWSTRKDDRNGIGIEFLSLSVENEAFVNAFTDLFKIQEFVPDEAQYKDSTH